MPAATPADLADQLRRYQLLDPSQLEVVVSDLLPRCSEPRLLARELIGRGWLTPLQVNQLFLGRGHELLLGSYVLLERLGEGGMGAVYKARNWKLGRVVALKLIRKERLAGADAVRRFHREIRAAAQLSHPNIVHAYDADEAGGTHFLIMEYAEGTDLSRLVTAKGPLSVEQACDCVRQAALGLHHAHERGLVHRDVKPANLLLTPGAVVKVLDLGLARLDAASGADPSGSAMTQEGVIMGTPDYVAPEQTLDSHRVDIRADLYSLGCTLYFLLTGGVPFPGGALGSKIARHQMRDPAPVEQIRSEVPAGVAAVVRKLMAKRPEDRYQTPAELAAALEALSPGPAPPGEDRTLVDGPPVGAAAGDTFTESLDFRPTEETVQALQAERRRQRRLSRRWQLAGAAAALLLGGAGLYLTLRGHAVPPAPPAPPPPAPREDAERAFRRWVEATAALPADRQVKAVAAKLRERNPGFKGPVRPTIKDGVVTGLDFRTDEVTDLAPLRALTGLRVLVCPGSAPGKGKLADLSPLRGLPLEELSCGNTRVSDLSPLRGMKLTRLHCGDTGVADLSPLQGMPLGSLVCTATGVSDLSPLTGMPLSALFLNITKVSDLSPLRGMKLIGLDIYATKVSDLSPLRGMKLTSLNCGTTKVSVLSPLEGMPLEALYCGNTPVSDLSPLRGMKLATLNCGATGVSDLSPLEGMPMTILDCSRTKVSSLSPLRGMPLRHLSCDFRPERDTRVLRSIKTLETINTKPVAQFWKEAGGTPPPKP